MTDGSVRVFEAVSGQGNDYRGRRGEVAVCGEFLQSGNRSGAGRFGKETFERSPDTGPSSTTRCRERSEASRILWKALEALPDDQREVIVLKELQGLRYQEIASVLAVPEGTVASRLFNARLALKEELTRMGVMYP